MRTSSANRKRARGGRALAVALVALTLALSTLAPTTGPAAAQAAPAPVATAPAPFDPAAFEPTALDPEPVFTRWGVEGRAPNIADGRYGWSGPQPLVWDITTLGDVAYVAGIFRGVRHNTSFWPNDPLRNQSFLAAFDRVTGEFLPTFAPVFDGPVYDIVALPNGTLLAGGEFTRVNGTDRAGLVALDPDTGGTVGTFPTTLAAPGSDLPAFVRELLVDGTNVYVAGSFSRVLDGADNFVWNVVRLDTVTGRLDRAWIPRVAGTVFDLDIDHSRGRVHLGGYFTSVDALPNTLRVAAVGLQDGRAFGGLAQYPANSFGNADVVGISYVNNAVWVVGGNHLVGVLDPVTNQRIAYWDSRSVTPFTGTGDLQVAETYGRYTIAGHHQDGGGGIRIFDNVARTRDDRWTPNLLHGWYGIWAIHLDRDGCLWIGGDMSATTTGHWLSGIAKFCMSGAAPPPPQTETNLAAGRPATQSSNWKKLVAARAVDGKTDGTLAGGSVSVTESRAQPWWQVDLGEARDVGKVEVFARTDCCPERNKGVWVLGSASPITAARLAEAKATPGVFAVSIDTLASPSTVTFNRSIRYLRVQLEATTQLALAEVKAYPVGTVTNVPPPTDVRATQGATSVILRWNAPTTDPVAGYVVHRDGVFKAWVGNLTFYQDLTAVPGQAYRYAVRSRVADGRTSAPVETTVGAVDTEAPTVPSAATGTAGLDGVTLSWSPSTDNRAVRSYLVHRDYQFLAVVTAATTYRDTTAVAGTRYRYEIRAQDSSGNTSGPSAPVVVTAGATDAEAPTVPTGVSAVAGADRVTLSWTASSDNRGVTGYLVHRDYQFLAFVSTGTSYTDTTAVDGTSYRYEIRAKDGAGNTSGPSAALSVAVGNPDVIAPTVPSGLSATTTATSAALTWGGSDDAGGVSGYLIHRDWTFVAWVPAGRTFTDTGLSPATAYRYQVRAKDAAGNTSAPTPTLTVTTPAA